ncbi:MAG: SusC/RagA family TonB-linked outer membrane protein [Chitinophagaceae bacterium]
MRKLLVLLTAILYFTGGLLAQKTVTGKVTDDQGNPIPNASVIIKGTNSGTVTNSDGTYSLTVPAEANTLIFSAVDMTLQEMTIGTNSIVNLSLKSENRTMAEVVVTSFGIKRDKKLLGYSTPTIKAEDLTAVRNSNISNSLVGKVAGVRTQGSGGSFTGSSILIRGYTSVTGSSAPLYVVDGLPIDNSGGGTTLQTGATSSNRVVDINPDDIESMTILKGAAATSSYGSRGAGGVILITTKKGSKKSKNAIELVSSYSTITANRLPEYQNEYAQGAGDYRLTVAGAPNPNYLKAVLSNTQSTSWGPRIDGRSYTDFYGVTKPLQAYPNNVKDLFENGSGLQNTISMSGGTDKTTYRVSYGNQQETYVIRNNKLNKNNISINLSSDVTKNLTISTLANYVNTTSRRTQQGNQLSNPVFRSWFTPRSFDLEGSPYYTPDGKQWYWGGEDNPNWSIENVRYRDENSRLYGNLGLNYKFTDWLNSDLKFGTDNYSFFSHGFDNVGVRGGGNSNSATLGGIVENRNDIRNIGSYFTINANKKFGVFGVSATVGNEFADNRSRTLNNRSTKLNVSGFDHISNATTLFTPAVGSTRSRTIGVFGDVVLDYNSWLSLNLKARNDWVSTLPIKNNSVFYPAAALSVVLTEAIPSIKSDFVNQLKIRTNYGKVGRGPGAYNTDNYASVGGAADGFGPAISFPFNNLLGYTINDNAGNPELKPEFTTEGEIGLDATLWNSRIILELNYYQRKLTEGLFSVPYSGASGISSVFRNAGEMDTKGVEVGLTLIPVRSQNFTWSISGNYTKFKTKVTQLAPGVSVITLAGFTTPNIRLVAGEEFGVIYGNQYNRDAQGRILLNANGLPTPTSGVFKIGNPNPKFTIGLSNTFSYKGFAMDVLVDIRGKGDIYSRNLADLRRNGVVIETADKPRVDKDNNTLLKNYQFEGVDVNGNAVNVPITAEQYWGNTGKYVAAEGFIVNTQWVRIREANLYYRLPKEFTNKTPFGNIEFGVFGRNLFLWTKDYPHLDPEQNVLGASNFQGLEFNANASTRTMGVNLRLTL